MRIDYENSILFFPIYSISCSILLKLIKIIDREVYIADNEAGMDEGDLQLINDHLENLRHQADAMED